MNRKQGKLATPQRRLSLSRRLLFGYHQITILRQKFGKTPAKSTTPAGDSSGYSMQNQQIAALFNEVADLLEIQGANTFRVRAYRNGARTLEGLTVSVADLLATPGDGLESLDGIGKDLASKIKMAVETGQIPQLEELRQQVPHGVVEMLRISGLGPKKVAVRFRELGIQSLTQLKEACEAGKISELKGFGKKTAAETTACGIMTMHPSGSPLPGSNRSRAKLTR